MEKVLEIREFEISSDCSCVEFDEDENESQASECWGCWDDDKTNFKYEILAPWLEANGWDEDTEILIKSENMNWDRVTGWAVKSASDALNALTLNGEFTLRYKLVGEELTCVRSSHDEMGALFTFNLYEEDKDSENE